MQNSVDFCKIRVWSRISPERIDISKIWKKLLQPQPLPRWAKKNLVNFGPQTTEIQWCILNHLNGFFRETIIRPLRGAAPSIFTHVRDWPRLSSAPPSGTGVPQKKFNGENLKFGLKFRVCAPITSGPVGVSSRNFFQTTCREAGVIMWVQLLEGPPPKYWEGQKSSKFRYDFWQLSTLIANISGKDRYIENRNKTRSTTTPSTLGEKTGWTLVHKQKRSSGAYWPTEMKLYGGLPRRLIRSWLLRPAHKQQVGVSPRFALSNKLHRHCLSRSWSRGVA